MDATIDHDSVVNAAEEGPPSGRRFTSSGRLPEKVPLTQIAVAHPHTEELRPPTRNES
jgi:hypothetical protein